MWLRLALNICTILYIFSACSPASDKQAVDKLNAFSYACHYRNIDSTEAYARKAMAMAANYSDGKAEAMNNLAFVRIAQMKYKEAKALLDKIPDITNNNIELLVAYIQQMRLCQRQSSNREFYNYKELAQNAFRRLKEDRQELNERQRRRLIYAESELAIVTSTYYYYVGLELQSAKSLERIGKEVEEDTAQYLNYLYNIGAGGIINTGSQEEIKRQETETLNHCLELSLKAGYPYFTANAKEALAEHLINNTDSALQLANDALRLFQDYGDIYQIAGAYRTLAACYRERGDYQMALHFLEKALADNTINLAPDLVASIREQLSVAFAAIDDKINSDINRNIYLDLQEQTRQDRSLEARAEKLEQTLRQMNTLLWAIGLMIALLGIIVTLLYIRYRRNNNKLQDNELKERENELKEQLCVMLKNVENSERRLLEQRAKVSLVNSITPFIDRVILEVKRMSIHNAEKEDSLQYIKELTEKINEQNDVLTNWIQLRQGELSLHIETFPLQPVFDIVAKSKRSFSLKGIELEVAKTECRVKADKVLTLFMINTLADNARKFTPKGGHVTIEAKDEKDYVEIIVSDTGIGMDAEQTAHVFEHKVTLGHGFGLMNCKGIIDKYKKISKIFSVCTLNIESEKGKGSRFSFRLPHGITRLITAVAFITSSINATATYDINTLTIASEYADSTFNSNVKGEYHKTITFADSCIHYLNMYYRQLNPNSVDTLLSSGDPMYMAPDIVWLHKNVPINYNILLTMRNETAVAALALHEWKLYTYNNTIFTGLFKELSADSTLDDYCRKMQQSNVNKQIAIILLVLFALFIFVAIAWQILVSLGKAAKRRQSIIDNIEMLNDNIAKAQMEQSGIHISIAVLDNCLSALKHETMYYPSRIKQLIENDDTQALPEVVSYYRDLFSILSMQAQNQTEHPRLHLKALQNEILGDENLLRYMFEIIRTQTGQKQLSTSYSFKGNLYVDVKIALPSITLTDAEAQSLFNPSTDHIPYLLCRQIVRDHGEATNRRACAIKAEIINNVTTIIITLPRAWKHSK